MLPAGSASTPRACNACSTGVTLALSSRPISNPRPRTSRTPGRFALRKLSMSAVPRRSARCGSCSACSACSAASAAAHASGFPPKVEPCRPVSNAPTRLPINTAPMGNPPARDFAMHSRSGCTPECSQAKMRPVRPMPVCTSSMISSAPRSWHRRCAANRYCGSAGRTPPSPCTTSRITAAVWLVNAASSASRSL